MFPRSRWCWVAVLVVTSAAAAAASPAPSPEAVAWAGDARVAARHRHCSAVRVLSDKVRATDPTYHAHVFVADPAIATCIAPGPERAQAIDPRTAHHRIGVDGFFSIGVIATVGGSVRYERKYATSALTARLTGLSGGAIESEDDGFDAAIGQLGYRAYWGRSYLAVEVGGTAIRRRRFYDSIEDDAVGASWTGFPSGSVTIGGKLAGQVDLGISGLFPFVGIGVHLGLDFKHW